MRKKKVFDDFPFQVYELSATVELSTPTVSMSEEKTEDKHTNISAVLDAQADLHERLEDMWVP